jgi:hypothetical protein
MDHAENEQDDEATAEVMDDDDDDDQAGDDNEELSILLGVPSAFGSGVDDHGKQLKLWTRDSLEDRQRNPGTSSQGCIATAECTCGQPMVMDLLTDNPLHECPRDGCGQQYTSLLVVCPLDDDQIFGDVVQHIGLVNEGQQAATQDTEPSDNPSGFPDAN